MSIADVLALNPCWDEYAIRVTARNKRLTKKSYDPREVLRRLRGYVSETNLLWLFQRYLARHHPRRALIAGSWADARYGATDSAEKQRHFVAEGHPYSSDERCVLYWADPTLDDIARVMDMTYAEALAVTE